MKRKKVEIAVYRIKNSAISSKKRPRRGWKERLGIETGRDLLIFSVVIVIAVTMLITLAFAGLGYIVPIPY